MPFSMLSLTAGSVPLQISGFTSITYVHLFFFSSLPSHYNSYSASITTSVATGFGIWSSPLCVPTPFFFLFGLVIFTLISFFPQLLQKCRHAYTGFVCLHSVSHRLHRHRCCASIQSFIHVIMRIASLRISFQPPFTI